MELKTIIAVVLVLFILGGLIFLKAEAGRSNPAGGRLCGAAPLHIPKKDERSVVLMRERFEQRLFRIFAQAGYSPVQLLTITPEEMVEIPGITVPNIRAVLCVQNKVLADRNKVRSGKLVEALLKEAEESGCCHE